VPHHDKHAAVPGAISPDPLSSQVEDRSATARRIVETCGGRRNPPARVNALLRSNIRAASDLGLREHSRRYAEALSLMITEHPPGTAMAEPRQAEAAGPRPQDRPDLSDIVPSRSEAMIAFLRRRLKDRE
jgi:hypothetical protein